MSKQLIIVSGAPHSGRTTWINKTYSSSDYVIVDAGEYPNLYVKSERNNTSKLFEDTIDDSRIWCLEKVRVLMEGEKSTETQQEVQQKTGALRIVLSLIACRPDRWREFIQLAISNEYEIVLKFPPNKHLFYSTRHNTSIEQDKFIETKVINRFPKDKKEVYRKNGEGEYETVMIETKESSLLRQIITETESAYAFYLQNRRFITSGEELLKKINELYKTAIMGEIKRAEKKLKDVEKEAEKKTIEAEKKAKKIAREEAKEEAKEAKLKKEQETQIEIEVQVEVETQVETQVEA